MTNTYLTSDTHFNHEMLVREGLRPFKTVEEMNETIASNWNDTVRPEDTVYFLGDFALGKNPSSWQTRLNGNIIFIRGNHDSASLSKITALEIVWEGTTLLLLHKPAHSEWFPTHDIIIHGHTHKHGKKFYSPKQGVVCANVNTEFHKYRPRLINEIVGMILNEKEVGWITYGGRD
jgi:calcineurin-like phosphoesterase family protein